MSLLRRGGDAESYLQSAVLHRAEVGQQLVVGVRWYGHVIDVEHVGGLRVVVVDAHGDAPVPQCEVETDVEGLLDFPFQVRIGIAHDAERDGWRPLDGYHAVGLHEQHGVVGVDASLVA